MYEVGGGGGLVIARVFGFSAYSEGMWAQLIRILEILLYISASSFTMYFVPVCSVIDKVIVHPLPHYTRDTDTSSNQKADYYNLQ